MTLRIRLISTFAFFLLSWIIPLQAYTVAEMKDMQTKVQQLVSKNTPAVVSLLGETIPGAGSGTIVSADGIILTAAHVTRGNEKMTVVFPDGRSVKCKVLGANYSRDVGLAKIEEAGTYPFVEMGDSDKLEPTTIVIAMGHPGGFDLRRSPPVRIGRINVKDPNGFLVSDCTLVGGDSGGPLFDLDGKVVGVHSSISESLTYNRHAPVNAAKADWQKLLDNQRWGRLSGASSGDPRRAVLGAVLDPESKEGVGLKEVQPKSPAAEAGLKAGDVILKFGGRPVATADELRARLGRTKPGRKVDLTYRRAEAESNTSVTLISEDDLMKRMEGGADAPAPPAPGKEPAPGTAPPDAKNPLKDMMEKLRKDGQQNDGKIELQLGPQELEAMLREMLEKQGVAREKLKAANLLELLGMLQGQNPDGTPGPKFEGLDQVRELLGLMDPALQRKLEDQFRGMLDGQRPGSAEAAKATFVLRDGKRPRKPVGLASGVNADGWLLAKASEITRAGELQCQVKGEWLAAKVQRTWKEHDLALVKIEAKDLPVVQWSDQELPVVGSFITAAAPSGEDPTAIGVVSVAARNQQEQGRGFLGVQVAADAKGLKIGDVVAASPALQAGLQRDDRVIEVDGKKPDSIFNFTKLISEHKAGDKVNLKLQRGADVIDKEIALGDRATIPGAKTDRRADRMDSMGSTVSKRRGDFANILQTDFPLDSNQCGGPVTDLDGHVIGLVIARSGRVETMVLPSATVRDVLGKVDFSKAGAN